MIELILLLAPACDLVIAEAADWARVNDANKRIVCVLPGDYSYAETGAIRLSASGTPEAPRYLIARDERNPDDQTHPAKLPPARQSVISNFSLEGSHWIIDRMVIRNSPRSNFVQGGASHNLMDRLLVDGAQRAGIYFRDARNNILRRSVLMDPPLRPGADNVHVYVGPNAGRVTLSDNEFINGSKSVEVGPDGLGNVTIQGNDMYVTSDRYTDCEGNLYPQGLCSCSEMQLVLKGVDLPGSTITIEGNRIWGMRPNDNRCASSGSPGHGIRIGTGRNVHQVSQIRVANNIVWDNQYYGIFVGNNVREVLIERNLISRANVGIQNSYSGADIQGNIFISNAEHYRGADDRLFGNMFVQADDVPEAVCVDVRPWTGPERKCFDFSDKAPGGATN